MIELQPVAADFAAHPKRKYTVTARVLAANRANLARANAVPREIRFRSTERRRQACYRNLGRALIAKKRDRSLHYASSFRHGWYVADPERALALVGATPEEYHRHLEAWRREVDPVDATEKKLSQAMGILSWRWITGVRLECDLETLRVYRLLDQLAAERAGTAAPGYTFQAGGTGTLACASAFEPSAAAGGCAASIAPPGVTVPPLTSERLEQLGYDLEEALGTWDHIIAPLEKIRDRMMRLWQELLRGRGEPLIDLDGVGCSGRRHEVAIDHEYHSAFELGCPFSSCSRIEETLSTWPEMPPPVEQWRAPQPVAAGPGFEDASPHEDNAFPYDVPASDAALLREARQRGWNLPGDFASFLRRVQAALGVKEPGGKDSSPGGGDTDATARWMKSVRKFARALWNHLSALRRHADRLLAIFHERLGDCAASLWPKSTPRPELTVRQTLARDVTDLDEEPDPETERRGEDLAQFCHHWLVKLEDEIHRRWRRWRAAVAVVLKGSRQLTVDS